jgi:hypothetical protein
MPNSRLRRHDRRGAPAQQLPNSYQELSNSRALTPGSWPRRTVQSECARGNRRSPESRAGVSVDPLPRWLWGIPVGHGWLSLDQRSRIAAVRRISPPRGSASPASDSGPGPIPPTGRCLPANAASSGATCSHRLNRRPNGSASSSRPTCASSPAPGRCSSPLSSTEGLRSRTPSELGFCAPASLLAGALFVFAAAVALTSMRKIGVAVAVARVDLQFVDE